MSRTLVVGEWIEPASRELTVHRTSYAADYEVLRTTPGRYPVRITLEGGYNIPMPYWVLVGIAATRTGGQFYNGCGGVNYSATPATPGPDTYGLQMYVYQLPELVALGHVVLFPEFAWLLDRSRGSWPQTWEEVEQMGAVRL